MKRMQIGVHFVGALLVANSIAATAAQAQTSCDGACEIAAAQAYLDALVSHDASAVPFAPDCQRVENGFMTGTSGPQLQEDLNNSLRYRVIFNLRDESIYVDGDQVFAIYSLDTGKLGDSGKQLATGRVFERFRVVNGQLTEIEAVFQTLKGYVAPIQWADQAPSP